MTAWREIYTWQNIRSSFPDYLKKNSGPLIRAVPVTYVASTLLHIGLTAFKYDGYSVSPGADVIGQGNLLIGTVKWILYPFFLFFGVGLLRRYGTAPLTAQLRLAPAGLATGMRQLEQHITERPLQERLLLAIGGASILSLLITRTLGHSFNGLFGLLALVAGALVAQKQNSDKTTGAVEGRVWVLLFCCAVGLFIGYLNYGQLGFPLVGLGFFLRWKRLYGKDLSGGGKAAVWLVFTVGSWLLWDFLKLGFADDGGFSEFRSEHPGGNPLDYLKDAGGQKVVGYGMGAGGVATSSGAAGDYAAHLALQGGAGRTPPAAGHYSGPPMTKPR